MKEIEEKFMTQGKFTSLVEDRVKESQGLITVSYTHLTLPTIYSV